MFDARIYLMVFSADWCSDCLEQVPALAKVLTMSENPNIVTKVVNFDDHRDVADELGITAIPTVLVLDKNFRELGRFIEKPSKYSTIEAEIWDITQKGVVRPEPAQPQIFTDHWV